MFRVLTLIALVALTVSAAELTGKWKGEAKRPDGSVLSLILLELKQDGATVSGTVGRDDTGESAPLENPKLSGDRLTFEVSGGSSLYKVSLNANGDSLKGTIVRNADGQDSPAMPVELMRQK